MDDEPSTRSTQADQADRPRRLYFDDLADDSETERPILRGRRRSEDDPTSDTGPIEPPSDPVAVGQQLFLDDAPDEPDEPEEPAEPAEPAGPPAADGPSPGRRRVIAILAVLGVLVLIAVIASVEAQGGNHPTRAASRASPPPSRHSAAPSAPTHATRRSPSPSPTAARATHRPTPSRAPTHAVPPPGVPTKAPLTVLNNTTVTGLAGRAATLFTAHGWSVSVVGNYTGLVSATTVYYDPASVSSRRAAQTLAAQFPQIASVAPRFAGLPGTGLTVVLAPDWSRP